MFVTGKPVVSILGTVVELSGGKWRLIGNIGSGHPRFPKGEFVVTRGKKVGENTYETENTVYVLTESVDMVSRD
jgi:hypothetical protein